MAGFGIAGAYFIHSGAYVVLLACLLLMQTTNPAAEAGETNPIRAIIEGLVYVRAETVIGTLILMEATMSIFGAYSQMMVIFAKDVFGMGPEGLGLLQSAIGAGSLVGSLTLAAVGDVHRKGRLLIASGVVYGASIVGFAFCPWFGLALVILFLSGLSDIAFGATRNTMIQLLVREEMRGRVMALSSVSMRGVGPLGGFQAGALATVVGVQWAIALGAIVVMAVTLGTSYRVPMVRRFTGAGRDGPAISTGPGGRVTARTRV